MGRSIRYAVAVLTLVLGVWRVGAQPPLSSTDILRVQDGVAAAFAFLYELPRDTAGAAMGTWVLDTAATTTPTDGKPSDSTPSDGTSPESADRWRIIVTKLTDTGEALRREEMTGKAAISASELAAAMAEMQQLEAKISRAEAEASLEIEIAVNRRTPHRAPAIHLGPRIDNVVSSARKSTLYRGYWTKIDDPDLGITMERWVPGKLLVHFAGDAPRSLERLDVTADGSEEMLFRLLREARWEKLAALFE